MCMFSTTHGQSIEEPLNTLVPLPSNLLTSPAGKQCSPVGDILTVNTFTECICVWHAPLKLEFGLWECRPNDDIIGPRRIRWADIETGGESY